MVDTPAGGADQEVRVRYILDADQVIQEMKEVDVNVERLKASFRILAEETGKSYEQISAALKKQQFDPAEYSEVARRALKELANEVDKVEKETKEASSETKLFGINLTNLGNIAKTVFAGIFGVTVLGVLRQFIQYLGQAVESGNEFVRSMFQLEVGIRAIQRTGVDITISQVYEQIDRLANRFSLFSKKELVEGSAALINLTRDIGFTRNQIFELQEAIATLAIINSRSMSDVQRTVALAISSGYTEGLQRLGVSINKVNIAQEAMRLGFGNTYLALTEQQRGLATLNLIMEKTAKFGDDVVAYFETLPGQIDKTTRAIEQQTAQIGAQLLPLQKTWRETQLGIVDGFNTLIYHITTFKNTFIFSLEQIKEAIYSIFPAMRGLEFISSAIGESLGKAFDVEALQEEDLENITKYIEDLERMLESREDLTEAQKGAIEDQIRAAKAFLGESYVELGDTIADEEANLTKLIEDAVTDRAEEIRDIESDYYEKRKELFLDFSRDMQKLERQHAARMEEINIDHGLRVDKIVRGMMQRIQDALSKYNLDVEQIWRDYYNRIEEAHEDYTEREYKLEQDFQEKMRKLREEFLFDLEDALRERDAKQVLRLMKRYELNKEQLKRDRELEKDENERRYKDQISDLERQRDERLLRLKEELDERINLIRENAKRAIIEERIRWKEQQKELERNLKNQEDERRLSYEQQREDLKDATDERLKAVADALAEELRITGEGANAIYQELAKYFGPGGMIEKIMKYYNQMVKQYLSWYKSAEKTYGKAKEEDIEEPKEFEERPKKEFGEGGILIARKPTTVTFGDKGPEVAAFSPLGRVGAEENKVFGGSLPGVRESMMRLFVTLSPGLEAQIVDNTLSHVAEVIVEKSRD